MNNMKNESQKKEKDLNKKTDQKSPQILKDQEKKASEYKSFKVVEDLKIKLKEVEDKLLRELAENDNLRKGMKKR